MKNIIFMLLLALAFNACSPSSLKLDKTGAVKLSLDDKTNILGKHTTKEKLLFFSDISIQQYKLTSNDGSILFGEYAYTDLMYQFYKTELQTCMYIFDESRNYEVVYRNTNAQLMQIQLKDKSYVNVLIYADSLQEFVFIYGFSNEEFIKLAEEIKTPDTEVKAPKFEGVVFSKDSLPQTNWNNKLIVFTPLLEVVPEMRR